VKRRTLSELLSSPAGLVLSIALAVFAADFLIHGLFRDLFVQEIGGYWRALHQ
jgi:hypothetical protein